MSKINSNLAFRDYFVSHLFLFLLSQHKCNIIHKHFIIYLVIHFLPIYYIYNLFFICKYGKKTITTFYYNFYGQHTFFFFNLQVILLLFFLNIKSQK